MWHSHHPCRIWHGLRVVILFWVISCGFGPGGTWLATCFLPSFQRAQRPQAAGSGSWSSGNRLQAAGQWGPHMVLISIVNRAVSCFFPWVDCNLWPLSGTSDNLCCINTIRTSLCYLCISWKRSLLLTWCTIFLFRKMMQYFLFLSGWSMLGSMWRARQNRSLSSRCSHSFSLCYNAKLPLTHYPLCVPYRLHWRIRPLICHYQM